MTSQNEFWDFIKNNIFKLIYIPILLLILLPANVYGKDIEAQIRLEEEIMKSKENTYIVKLDNQKVRRIFSNDNFEIIGDDLILVGGDDLEELEGLKKDGGVIYIEENRKLHILHSMPNDPYYPQQWGLHSIMAEEAWDLIARLGQKRSITVAVIDTGVDLDHEDLQGRIAEGGYNFISNNGDIRDFHGHGTGVAGTMAAVTNNGKGIAGIAGNLDVKILPLKTANAGGTSLSSHVIKAIDYAIDKNVDIINLSFGSRKYLESEYDTIQKAVSKGIIVIAAGGNNMGQYVERFDPMYPASYDNVISVGSISADGRISDFSYVNDKIDIFAPGENIYTTYNKNSYVSAKGTSFSAPIVAGVVASLLAIDPSLGLQDIREILDRSATKIYESFEKIDRDNFNSLNYYRAVQETVRKRGISNILKVDKEWEAFDQPVSDIKPWKIEFNKELDRDSIDNSIYIFDSHGNQIDINMGYDEDAPDGNIIILEPEKPYRSGEKYYLFITDKILSRDGLSLNESVLMEFSVEKN